MKQVARWLLAYLVLLAIVAVCVAAIAPHLPATVNAWRQGRASVSLAEANAYVTRTSADVMRMQAAGWMVAGLCGLVAFGGFGAALVVLALRAQRRERWMLAGRRQAALPADLVPSDTTRCFPLELRWGITAEEVRARIAELQARGEE